MGYMDHTLKKTVPYYSTMKRAGAFKQQEPRKRQKRTTLTEYSQNGQKAILKPHVTVNQAAKKLYDYEQTGLSPHEVANLVEQVQNLTRRVKKYESWEEIRKLGRMNGVDRCLICGEVIPEGSQVCTACRNKYDIVTGETEEMAQELRDIADVLKITEGTDTNIRKSMESILRIADRLERTSNGKKRR